MLSLILISLAAPAATPTPGRSTPPARCRLHGPTPAGKGNPRARPRKLGELPPARHYLAVERDVGGCPEPAIVRSSIGAGGR